MRPRNGATLSPCDRSHRRMPPNSPILYPLSVPGKLRTPHAPPEQGRFMKAVRALAVLVLVLLVSPSCGEPPTAPVTPAAPIPGPDASLIGSLLAPTGLLQCSGLPSAS